MNSVHSGNGWLVCWHVCRVCNSGIPDAFYLARLESGLLYSCPFIEDCGLSPGAWCHIRVTLHGSAWSLPLKRHYGTWNCSMVHWRWPPPPRGAWFGLASQLHYRHGLVPWWGPLASVFTGPMWSSWWRTFARTARCPYSPWSPHGGLHNLWCRSPPILSQPVSHSDGWLEWTVQWWHQQSAVLPRIHLLEHFALATVRNGVPTDLGVSRVGVHHAFQFLQYLIMYLIHVPKPRLSHGDIDEPGVFINIGDVSAETAYLSLRITVFLQYGVPSV